MRQEEDIDENVIDENVAPQPKPVPMARRKRNRSGLAESLEESVVEETVRRASPQDRLVEMEKAAFKKNRSLQDLTSELIREEWLARTGSTVAEYEKLPPAARLPEYPRVPMSDKTTTGISDEEPTFYHHLLASSTTTSNVYGASVSGMIEGVPYTHQAEAEEIFSDRLSISRGDPRWDLLCTAAARGFGKTVMQGVNLRRFLSSGDASRVEVKSATAAVSASARRRQSQTVEMESATIEAAAKELLDMRIGIELTFNHDFSGVPDRFRPALAKLQSANDLEPLFGAMTMARLAEYVSGKRGSESTPAKEAFLKAVFANPPPLGEALSAVREALGAPPNARVLLCVDELTNFWPVDRTKNISSGAITALKWLCYQMDASDGRLVLSVTAYGLLDIQEFGVCGRGSHRSVCLQPLPPVFPLGGLSETIAQKLPRVLQPFAKERTRQQLCFDKEHLEIYALLSRTLAATGGHPGRVQYCFRRMRELPSPQLDDNGVSSFTAEARAEIEALCSPPTTGRPSPIERGMDAVLSFDVAVETLLDKYLVTSSDRDQFFRDIANPYQFPRDDYGAEWHNGMLQGSHLGVCQFASDRGSFGFTFVPLPALVRLARAAQNPGHAPSPLQAQCNEAVMALVAYQNDTKSNGKLFAALWARVLCFFLNCKEYETTVRALVGKYSDAPGFQKTVHCGNVRWIDGVTTFPGFFKQTELQFQTEIMQLQCETPKKTEEWLRQQLKANEDGFMFIPTEENNLASDFVAVLRVKPKEEKRDRAAEYILVSFQAKDCITDTASSVHCLDGFRWGQQFYRSDSVFTAPQEGKLIPNPFASIDLKKLGITETLHVLLTANPIVLGDLKAHRCSGMSLPQECRKLLQQAVNDENGIQRDELVGGLSHICPSFGFAARNAHTLRKLFLLPP